MISTESEVDVTRLCRAAPCTLNRKVQVGTTAAPQAYRLPSIGPGSAQQLLQAGPQSVI